MRNLLNRFADTASPVRSLAQRLNNSTPTAAIFFEKKTRLAWLRCAVCTLLFLAPLAEGLSQVPFIITVKTDNPGTSNSTSFTISTFGGGYNYEVDWNDDGLYDQTGLTGNVTHDYGSAGTYTLRIRGAFPRIHFGGGDDCRKLLDVNQWGSIAWTSMESAFSGCSYLMNITATDVPDLSGVTDMSNMFRECTILNGPANIGTWNTANVTDMSGLFYEARRFNQPIGNWNTANVTSMRFMFYYAQDFNQPIGNWNTANVTTMYDMFERALDFNQPIGDWNTSKVTDMGLMFYDAQSFNQPIGDWNTSAVTSMAFMFGAATSFNQPIGDWNTGAVSYMRNMFSGASAFNQPIGDWNTAAVFDMRNMFSGASAFNQPLGTWSLHAGVDMASMLNNCGMDCANYSVTLNGWAANPATPSGRTLGATGRQYGTNVVANRATLTGAKGWTISGDAVSAGACGAVPRQGDEFIITVKTDNPGTSNSTSFTISTLGGGYNYEVDWNDDGLYDQTGLTGNVTHDYGAAGTYTLRIRGAFPRIHFGGGDDCRKLLDVNQWGSIAWTSMENAFTGCSNLNITATDVPDLSGVTDMSNMFRECTILNGPANIGTWNTANVTDMSGLFYEARRFNQPVGTWNTANVTSMRFMFYYAQDFNQPIGNWNTANVTTMYDMFERALDFNQPIGDWNTSKVTDMGLMFYDAQSFNQPIGDWNTSAVTSMAFMFGAATSFNQPIGDWNTGAVSYMRNMFSGASAFNQPIGDWNTAAVFDMRNMFSGASAFNQPLGVWSLHAGVDMAAMLNNSGMDCANYSVTLNGWAANPATPSGRTLGATGRQYGTNAAAARNTLTGAKGWTITGDAPSGTACVLCAAPSAVCKPATAVLNAAGQATITVADVDGGSTYECGLQSMTVSPDLFDCSDLGPQTVTLTVTDINGDSDECEATVTVVDNTLPGITCPGPATVTCASQLPAVNLAAVTASDNCSVPVKSHVGDETGNQTCANRFTVTRTYRATDASGNSATCSQVITVYDNVKPNFTSVPANVTVQCNSIPAVGAAIATDGCGGSVSVVYNGQTTTAGNCPDTYTLTRQWTATDACGNTKTATQRINVIDTQKPNFTTMPANVTVQCNAVPAPASPTATDNCDAAVAVTYNGQTQTNGACANAYTLTRTWTAADNCGNTKTVTQRITVVDNGKPVFTTFPENTTIACHEIPPAVGTPTASDGCGSATVTYLGQSTTSGNCPGNYQIKRTWRATDACGNSTAATQTIQVSDTGAPVFTSTPGPLTIECGDPLPPLVNPTASDACGGYVAVTFLGNVPSGSGCAQDYTVTRTWEAEDLCGNTATTSQVITVQGNSYGEEGAENRNEDATGLITHRSSLIVTPNPTTDRFLLDLSDFAGEAVTVSVVSDLGRLVWERRIPVVEEQKLPISLLETGAKAGIYTVSVSSARGVDAKRVVLVE